MWSHGDYTLSVDGNIIKLEAIGSFNLEGASKVYEEIKEIIMSFKDKPYYIVVNLLKFTGGTSEAYELSDKTNYWMNNFNPPVKRIYIVDNKIKMSITLSKEKELSKQNLVFFENEETANKWISINIKNNHKTLYSLDI
jgi:hypothetical protein